ncbi:MAG: hypothetical protein JSW47_03065 [Phycisphaerales bacterium]|nr:MAG: hypothetical protein JSW47_03065 [Phycisphaerales bacterium]
MYSKVLMPMVIVLVLSTCTVRAAIIDSTWIGPWSSPWGNPDNWSPPVIPNNTADDTFVVTIGSAGEFAQVGLLRDFTIGQLHCYGTVDIEKRTRGWKENVPTIGLTLSETEGLTNHGSLELDGEDGMRIIGNVTNAPGADMEIWGVLDIEEGTLHNSPGAHIYMGGDDIAVEGGGLDNRGSITIDPETEFMSDRTLHNAGRIYIRGGQCQTDNVLDNSSTGVVEGFGYLYAEQLLRNNGRITASGGTLSILIDGSMTNAGIMTNNAGTVLHVQSSAADLDNEGIISVNAGGAVTFNGGLNNKPSGTIQLKGGTFAATELVQTAGATFEGFGSITGNVAIESDGIIKLTGHTNIVGNVAIEHNAVLEISDGQVLITGHTTCNGTIHMKGGRIVPQGGLSGDCNVVSEPSIYGNIADLGHREPDFRAVAFLADNWLRQTNWH